jgi:hypothetical protein
MMSRTRHVIWEGHARFAPEIYDETTRSACFPRLDTGFHRLAHRKAEGTVLLLGSKRETGFRWGRPARYWHSSDGTAHALSTPDLCGRVEDETFLSGTLLAFLDILY